LNQFTRNLMLWGVISLAMVIVFNLFSQPQHSSQPSVTYSEFLRQAAKGEVSEVVIQGNTLTGKTTDGKSFQIYVPNDPGLVDKLIAEKVEVRAEPVEDSPWYMTLLVSWFPMLLLIGVDFLHAPDAGRSGPCHVLWPFPGPYAQSGAGQGHVR